MLVNFPVVLAYRSTIPWEIKPTAIKCEMEMECEIEMKCGNELKVSYLKRDASANENGGLIFREGGRGNFCLKSENFAYVK